MNLDRLIKKEKKQKINIINRMDLNIPKYNINEFIAEKCTLKKEEVKHIFENYKFIANLKYLIKKLPSDEFDKYTSSNLLVYGIFYQ